MPFVYTNVICVRSLPSGRIFQYSPSLSYVLGCPLVVHFWNKIQSPFQSDRPDDDATLLMIRACVRSGSATIKSHDHPCPAGHRTTAIRLLSGDHTCETRYWLVSVPASHALPTPLPLASSWSALGTPGQESLQPVSPLAQTSS